MKKIIIINGPNLNLLGKREPEIYGKKTFDDFFQNELVSSFPTIELSYFQSNHEGEIIDKLHEVGFSNYGIVINPGGYSHYSISILDALKSIDAPAIEVHISDIEKREEFRKKSITSLGCIDCIKGLGLNGYIIAIQNLIQYEL